MSLINTRLTNFRAFTDVDKWEVRASQYGMFDLLRSQTNSPGSIITPDLTQKAINAVGSTLEIPVLDAETFTITNVTQPVIVTGSPGTSQLYAVTFVNYYFGFKIWPAQHKNNEIEMQREFDRKLRGFIFALLKAWDIASETLLEAKKTQVLTDTLGGRYSLDGSDVVVGPLAEEGAMLGDLDPLQAGNNFFDRYDIVGNQALRSHVRNKLMEKSVYNTENKTYQWEGIDFHWSPEIANAAGHKATGFAVQKNSVGFLQQFAPDNLLGHRTHKHIWDIETLPLAGVPVDIYQYDDAEDANAIGGAATAHLTASKMQAFGFHSALAMVGPYISAPTTNPSSIMKFAIANS